MNARALSALLLFVLWIGCAFTAAAPAPDAGGAAQIRKLVEQLGSGDFEEREQASAALAALGSQALDALRQAATSSDPEVRRRALDLVAKMDRRSETEKLLVAKRVGLRCMDTPLADAVAQLRQASGYNIVLQDPAGKLRDRKVTLELADVPFWEAIDRFCAAADLSEANGQPLAPPLPPPGVNAPNGARLPIGPALARAPLAMNATPNQITLVEGRATGFAASYNGAARVRARIHPGVAAPAGQHLLEIQTSLEPSLRWTGLTQVRIDRAVDADKQPLQQLVAEAEQAGPFRRQAPFGAGYHQYYPLALRKGDKPSKSLAELSGVVTGQVRTAPKVYLSADDLLHAAGKTFKGAQGGSLTIRTVAKLDGDRLKVQFDFELPPGVEDPQAGFFPQGNGIQFQIQQVVPLPPPAPRPIRARPKQGVQAAPPGPAVQVQAVAQVEIELPALPAQPLPGVVPAQIAIARAGFNGGLSGFSLLDDQGQAVQQVGTESRVARDAQGIRREFGLTFQLRKGQTAARLVYQGSKQATLEIPFTLRDVPLP